LGSLNDLAGKRRRGDVVTDKGENFRPLGPHMPGMKMRTVFKGVGCP
jgi:hypothetical protein